MRVLALREFSIASVLMGAVAATATAGTIVVKPGTTYPTIQSGCDAAASGDVVSVTAGTYHETVMIPLGRSIELKAKGRVIVDGRGPGGAALGPGVLVFDSSFKISGFEFRNQTEKSLSEPGIGVQLYPQGIPGTGALVVENCVFDHCRDNGVLSVGGITKIRNCSFRDIGSSFAIDLSGSDSVVENCELFGCRGVVVVGARTVIRNCDLRNIAFNAIDCVGNDGVIEKNVVEVCQANGIKFHGDTSTLRKNRISSCGEAGMKISGSTNSVEANVVDGAVSDGIRIEGDGMIVHGNEIRRVRPSTLTIPAVVSVPAALHLVGSNGSLIDSVVEDCSGMGISLQGNSNLANGNRVVRCGTSGYVGIFATGLNLSLTQNEVSKQSGDGIYVDAATATVAENDVTDCSRDGFDLNGQDIFVSRNSAKKNGAEGFDLNVVNVSLVKNTAKGNRLDIATVGSITTFQGNHYQTGGPTTLPEVE